MGKHMTDKGKHPSAEDLIDHYYGEEASAKQVERHLKACAHCAREFSALQRDLGGVKSLTPPTRGERLRGRGLAVDSRFVDIV